MTNQRGIHPELPKKSQAILLAWRKGKFNPDRYDSQHPPLGALVLPTGGADRE